LAVSAQEKYDLFVLVVTDIINSDSKILVVGAEKDKVGEAFNVQLEDDMAFLSGVVSRKKQIVPQITEALTK
ncbi:DHHA2 domain-containing protein, partial [Staphylococcus aureus]